MGIELMKSWYTGKLYKKSKILLWEKSQAMNLGKYNQLHKNREGNKGLRESSVEVYLELLWIIASRIV